MGSDIHGVFQKRVGDKWEKVDTDYEFNRHYQLFAVLADVRNGVGVAGIKTGDRVDPIAYPRDFPEDWVDSDAGPNPWIDEGYDDTPYMFMGDHSFSWLRGDEMLEWYKNAPTIEKVGILSKDEFNEWDGKSEPQSYYREISGHNIIVAECLEDLRNCSHVKVNWKRSLRGELAYFFDEVIRLERAYGDIRFVFGFDS